MANFEADLDILQAIGLVKQQSDEERHVLCGDHDKECRQLLDISDQLQTENSELRRELECLREHWV